MDPNNLLLTMRSCALDIVDRYKAAENTGDNCPDEPSAQLAEAFLRLDDWLCKSGAKPRAWWGPQ